MSDSSFSLKLKAREKGVDDVTMEQPGENRIRHYINPRNVLQDFVYTIIISTVIAAFLTVTGITTKSFLINFVMSQSFGIPICSTVLFLLWMLKPNKISSFALIFVIGIGGGTLIGLQTGPFVLRQIFSIVLEQAEKGLLQTLILAITFGSVASYFFYSRARLRVSEEQIQQEKIKRLSSEKGALEANLRLLQAQVEPHFLFNTLSNILSLIDTNPANGKSMLVDLIHYLRTSLSRTFPGQITLDREIDMIKAYLNIQKIRMGERLHFQIELPEALREHPFPPMLLQPLVENAVKHGLEPKMEGGEIMIQAAEEDDLIRIEVRDTGLGFSSFQGTGVGIGNVKERIQLLYGGKGRLKLEENKPNGVRAIVEVPKHVVQGHHC
jgi:sensor histidine kinase YesM